MAVKIITDNCCDLPEEIIREYDIRMVHMLVRFGIEEFLPENLNLNEFYKMMEDTGELPTTSQPIVEELINTYSKALEDGSEVVAIHLSSGITGTVQTAQMIAGEMPGKDRLHIIDSKKASTGLGLVVIEAGRMAKAGADADTIIKRIEDMQKQVRCLFTVNNLEYLAKGGRISKTAGLLGNVLDIRPILHFDKEGFIVPVDKIRGRKAVMKKLMKTIQEDGVNLQEQTVGVSHGACPEDADFMYDFFKNEIGAKEVVMGRIGPVIGSHVGPGTLAVFYEGLEAK